MDYIGRMQLFDSLSDLEQDLVDQRMCFMSDKNVEVLFKGYAVIDICHGQTLGG